MSCNVLRPAAILRKAVVAVTTLLGLACSRQPVAASLPQQPDRIVLERFGCYGPCPVYRLSIDATGVVAYEGLHYVQQFGQQEARLPPGAFEVLSKQFVALDGLNAPKRWLTEPTCGGYVTDGPVMALHVRMGGREIAFRHDTGCNGPRDREAWLHFYDQVDELSSATGWIGPREPTPERDATPRTRESEVAAAVFFDHVMADQRKLGGIRPVERKGDL